MRIRPSREEHISHPHQYLQYAAHLRLICSTENDKAFISLTGLNVETLMELHQILFCNIDTATTGRK